MSKFNKVVLILSLIAFISTDLFVDISGSQPAVRSSPSSQQGTLDVETLTIPEYLGRVKGSFKGSSGKTIIYIQDAHCNLAAQKKIAELIGYLTGKYDIDTVNLEGGCGNYDLSVFTSISEKNIREKVSEYFVSNGEVNGAEFYSLNNPNRVFLWGIEDRELYLKNLQVYRESLGYEKEVITILDTLSKLLNKLKLQLYSEDLLKMDIAYIKYKSGDSEFRDYLLFLSGVAEDNGVDMRAYPNLSLLIEAMKKETEVDFKKASIERDKLIGDLEKGLSKKEKRELIKRSLDFKNEKTSKKEFYDYLYRKAEEIGIDTGDMIWLSAYMHYEAIYESVERSRVMNELGVLESTIKENMFQDDAQKELDSLSHCLVITRNIFGVNLTKEDYLYYLKKKGNFKSKKYIDFINKHARSYNVKAEFLNNILKLDEYIKRMISFYEYSFLRDEAFIKNIRFGPSAEYDESSEKQGPNDRAGPQSGEKAAIVITGGFHCNNFCELLKKNNISYVSIFPEFVSSRDHKNPYYDLLAGHVENSQRKLCSVIAKVSMIQIASMLSPILADSVYSRSERYAFLVAVKIQDILARGNAVRVVYEEGGGRKNSIVFGEKEGEDIDTEEIDIKDLLQEAGYFEKAPGRTKDTVPEQKFRFLEEQDGEVRVISGHEFGNILNVISTAPFVCYENEDGSLEYIFGRDATHNQLSRYVPEGVEAIHCNIMGKEISIAQKDSKRENIHQRIREDFEQYSIISPDIVDIENPHSGIIFTDPITGSAHYFTIIQEEGRVLHTDIFNELNAEFSEDLLKLQGRIKGVPQGIISRINNDIFQEGGEPIYTVKNGEVFISDKYKNIITELDPNNTYFERRALNNYRIIWGEARSSRGGEMEQVVRTQFYNEKDFLDFSLNNLGIYKLLTESGIFKDKKLISGKVNENGDLKYFNNIQYLPGRIYGLKYKDVKSAFKASLGNKGARLGDMTKMGLPIPGGFILTTNMYFDWFLNGRSLSEEMKEQIALNLRIFLKSINKDERDLNVSVRSSGVASLPGVYETKTDIKTIDGIYRAVEDIFASWGSEQAKSMRKAKGISDGSGIAIVIQEMVDGARNEASYAGVITTMDPATGNNKITGEYLLKDACENIVNGSKNTIKSKSDLFDIAEGYGTLNSIESTFAELEAYAKYLEKHYKYPQQIEFTVEDGELSILQTRNAEFKKGEVELRFIDNMVKTGILSEDEALKIAKEKMKGYTYTSVDDFFEEQVIAEGTGANAGAVRGYLAFTKDKLLELKQEGKKVIFVSRDNEFEDYDIIQKADGFISLAGGTMSHASAIIMSLDKPLIVGIPEAELDEITGKVSFAGDNFIMDLEEGIDAVTIDGRSGLIFLDDVEINSDKLSLKNLNTFNDVKRAVNMIFQEFTAETSDSQQMKESTPYERPRNPRGFVGGDDPADVEYVADQIKRYFEDNAEMKFGMSRELIILGDAKHTFHRDLNPQMKIADGRINPLKKTIEIWNLSTGGTDDPAEIFRQNLERNDILGAYLDGFSMPGGVFHYIPRSGEAAYSKMPGADNIIIKDIDLKSAVERSDPAVDSFYDAGSAQIEAANSKLKEIRSIDKAKMANYDIPDDLYSAVIGNVRFVAVDFSTDDYLRGFMNETDALSYNETDKNGEPVLVIVANAYRNRHKDFLNDTEAFRELISHEYMEKVLELPHGDIKALETALNNTALTALNKVMIKHMTMDQMEKIVLLHDADPGGKFYRAVQTEILSRRVKEVLEVSRPGTHPTIIVIPISEEQELFNKSEFTRNSQRLEKVFKLEYGVNVQVIFYKDGTDKDDLEYAITKVKDGTRHFKSDPDSRIVAFSNEKDQKKFADIFSLPGFENKSYVVKGDFTLMKESQRFSHAVLTALGLALMEWDRDKERGLGGNIMDLLRAMGNEGIDDYINSECDGNVDILMRRILNGLFLVKIQKIDYDSIRDYSDAEAAILMSL